MAEKTSYEVSNIELINRFGDACARAGIANSGLCIDFTAGDKIVQVNYLKGVILARLDGQKPPFEPGMKVRIKKEVVRPVPPKHYDAPNSRRGQTYTINRVWYDDGRWYLTFKELEQWSELKAQYPATQFCLVESTAEVAPAAH